MFNSDCAAKESTRVTASRSSLNIQKKSILDESIWGFSYDTVKMTGIPDIIPR